MDQLDNACMMDATFQPLASTKHLRVYATCALDTQLANVHKDKGHVKTTTSTAVTAQGTRTSQVVHSTQRAG